MQYIYFLPQHPLAPCSRQVRSASPPTAEWALSSRSRDRAQIIMAHKLSAVMGVGELAAARDYLENGSIHESVSNEGKNWSKSSTWKPCSTLRWSFCTVCLLIALQSLVQQCSKRGVTAMTLALTALLCEFLQLHLCSPDLPTFHFPWIFQTSLGTDLEKPEE